jgi:hypothetical protein
MIQRKEETQAPPYPTALVVRRLGSTSGDEAKVSAALANLDDAPITAPLRATLRMLTNLLREGSVAADNMRELLAAGVSGDQIEDALAVAFAFDVTNTLAGAFGFTVPGPKAFEAGAAFLLSRGYR